MTHILNCQNIKTSLSLRIATSSEFVHPLIPMMCVPIINEWCSDAPENFFLQVLIPDRKGWSLVIIMITRKMKQGFFNVPPVDIFVLLCVNGHYYFHSLAHYYSWQCFSQHLLAPLLQQTFYILPATIYTSMHSCLKRVRTHAEALRAYYFSTQQSMSHKKATRHKI